MHVDAHPIESAERAFGERSLHGGERRARTARNAYVHLVGADHRGREHRPVEHEVRRDGQQQPILDARRLAFDPVGDDERPARRLPHGLQLAMGGKPGAARDP